MKFYVAGKFERKAEVRAVQRLFTEAGHELTHDWTEATAEGDRGPALVQRLTEEAEADYFGASEAEVFVLLHDDACKGAFAELGVALASGALCIIVGGRCAKGWPIFYFHPEVIHVGTPAEALAFVRWTDEFVELPQRAAPKPDPVPEVCGTCRHFIPGSEGTVARCANETTITGDLDDRCDGGWEARS